MLKTFSQLKLLIKIDYTSRIINKNYSEMSFFKSVKGALGLETENPHYEVLQKIEDNIEIRKYDKSKWVCSSVEAEAKDVKNFSSSMFYKLFDYISGKNSENKKIAMTTPVTTVYNNEERKMIGPDSKCSMSMRFYVPKEFQDNTPVPTGDAFLQSEGDLVIAAIRFGGFATMDDYLKNRDILISKLGDEATKYDTINMITAGYDAPFKPVGRRNEVWLKKIE